MVMDHKKCEGVTRFLRLGKGTRHGLLWTR